MTDVYQIVTTGSTALPTSRATDASLAEQPRWRSAVHIIRREQASEPKRYMQADDT